MNNKEVIKELFEANPGLKPQKESQINKKGLLLLHELSVEDVHREWIWEGYIAKGSSVMLSAMFKSGKSTLIRAFLSAMQAGQEFVGMPVTPCNVLIISEESVVDWVEKRDEFGLDSRTNIYMRIKPFGRKPSMSEWLKFIAEVLQDCIAHKIDLVIFDTLPSIWPVENENDASQCLGALLPLNSLLRESVAVLIVWHFRKDGEGHEGTASRGSSAIMGWVDNIIEFKRMKENPLQREIKTFGRFDSQEVVIAFKEDNTYSVVGTKAEASKKERIKEIVNIFKEYPNQSLCQQNVTEYLQKKGLEHAFSKSTVNSYLKELVKDKIITVAEEKLHGSRKVPYYLLDQNMDSTKDASQPSPAHELTEKESSARQGSPSSEGDLVLAKEVLTIPGEHDIDELLDKTSPLYKMLGEQGISPMYEKRDYIQV